jgi:glyoxylase-like metal-dependent hydrolase (beta-lactamase superfamily II)
VWKKGFASLVLVATFAAAGAKKEAKSAVEDVARTIGAANLKTIQYSATGFTYVFGQSYFPDGPYPKFYAKYSRIVDYEKGLSREETLRKQFENPPRGGGQQPIYKEARGVSVIGENSLWGTGALALTPHGWVKAAMASSPTTKSITLNGKPGMLVSFLSKGKYKVDGYVNDQNLLEKVDTWRPDPILGDILIETTYSGYKDFGDTKFPTRIVQTQGGHPVLELNVNDVQTNVEANIQAPPPPPPAHTESKEIAKGVWYLAGTPDPNSMAVEFKDYTVLIESSFTEARALANIAEVKRLVPGKPIRYHINSHHHSDHAAGLRAFVAEGSTIITHESNKSYYEHGVLRNSHELEPDLLSRDPKPAKFIWVKEKYVLTDGDRRLEIYWVHDAGHTSNLLMSYMPKEKLLFITDIFNQFGEPRPNDPPPGIVTPYYSALGDNLKRLNLDVEWIAPSHGKGVVSADLLKTALVGTVQAPPVQPAGY